jgi:enamine deaminase RidA (YjgF/YER057c/UK114 family)
MARQNISSGAPFEATVGYSRAVKVGDLVFVAGTTAVDETGKVHAPGDAEAQTDYVLQKIGRALQQAGAGFADVVRTRIFVTDIKAFDAVGRAHGRVFAEIRPAATMVEVSALVDPAMIVEIEVDAVIGAGRKG